MANRDFNIDLKMRADFAQAQAELRKAQGNLKNLVGGVNTANLRGQAMAAGIRTTAAAITAASVVAVALSAKYIANTIESEKVQAQLTSRIKDTGATAGRSLEQLNAQAEKLQNLSVFDDEAVGEAQAMLLTFKQIQGVNFDGATESALDLATVMGTDASDAAKLLGKALNDPERGLAALTKAGITFTEAERAKIKEMVEAGRVAEAQGVILQKLSGTMGTAAEAARDTLGGAMQALENSFENVLEGDSGDAGVVGTRDAIESLITTLNDPATKQGFDAMIGHLGRVANFAAQAIAAVGGLSQAVADALAKDAEKSRVGLLSRRADLADDLADLQKGGLAKGNLLLGGRSGEVGFGSDAEIIAKLQKKIADADALLRVNSSLRGQFDPNFRPGRSVHTPGQGQFANVLGGGELAPAGITPPGADPAKKKTGGGKASDPDADIKRRIEGLKEERALLDAVAEGEEKASEAAKVRFEITEGEFKNKSPELKAQLLAAAEALDLKNADIEAEKKRKEAIEDSTDAYEDLIDELRTPAEIAIEEAIDRVDTLNEAMKLGIGTKAAYDDALGRIAGGLVDDQPDFQGLAPEVGGAFGELGKLDDAAAEEDKWYQDSLARLEAFRQLKAENKAAADAQEEQLEAAHQARLHDIEAARQQATLSIASDFFGQLAQLQRSENSKIATIGKAAAIAQALINTYQSATAAYAAMASIPYVGPALGVAAAAAAVAAGLANVAQIRNQDTGYAEGGWTGPGGKFKPAGTVHAEEFVHRREVVRQPGARDFLEDFNERGMEALHAWRGYADGGMVAERPRMSSPDWKGMARASQQASSNHLRVYLLNNEDDLAQRLAQHPAMEKAVVAIAGQNGNSIRADW